MVAENRAVNMRSAEPSHINSSILMSTRHMAHPNSTTTTEHQNSTRRSLHIVVSPHDIEANAFQLPSLDFEGQRKSFRIDLSFEGDSDIPILCWGATFYLQASCSEEDFSTDFSPHSNALVTSAPLNWSVSLGYIFTAHESESNSLLPSPIDLYDSINEYTRIHVFARLFRELSATAARSEAETVESLRDEGVVGSMLRLSQYMITFHQVRRA